MNNKTLLLISKGISYIGTKFLSFSLSWYILTSTGSGLDFSISLIVNYIPTIIMSFFAGHISDNTRNPKWLLVGCDLASAAVCFLPIVSLSIPTVYITIFLLSAISAVFNNVIDAHLSNLEGIQSPDDLKRLMSSMQLIVSGVNIISPAIGGMLIHIIPIRAFALLNLASFLLSALGECWLRYQPRKVPPMEKTAGFLRKSTSSAVAYLLRQNELRTFLIGDALSNFCVSAGISVALPLIITQTLNMSSGQYGIITSALAMGSLMCSFKHVKYPEKTGLSYPYARVGMIGTNILVIALIAYLSPNTVTATVILIIIQFINGWLTVSINLKTVTTFQLHVPDTYRGKALGMMTSLSYILIPFSLILSGIITEVSKASYLLPLGSGTLLLAALLLLKLSQPHKSTPCGRSDIN